MANLLAFLELGRTEGGCDEAGRGCLSGPVVAAAVVLDPNKPIAALNDSKKINEKNRLLLRDQIMNEAISYAIGIVTHEEIDEINILNASFLAMHRAVDQLKVKPAFLLIDGNRFKAYPNIPHACIIKGDAKYQSIAAASILAKTKRDEIMENLHDEFPVYQWKKNKGYPTVDHRSAIEKYGPSPHHRMTFRLLPDKSQLDLFE
ncbi:MAG: ribonuclease HII [Crocinitomicaceae bacterium]|nr:ribonuclease HII [Crocinitomicaceae bacterium]MBP6033580.1 ribonuclease HII [Crocinitomicaceae bacterium]